MAIVNLGVASGKSLAGTTLAITTLAAVPAGALIVVCIGTSGVLSATSNGVTATGQTFRAGASEPINTSGQGNGYLRYAWNAAALASGSTITVTFTATGTVSGASAFYWDGAATASDPYQSTITGLATGSSTTPSAALSGAPTANSLIVGMVARNGPTADGFTQDSTNAAYATPPNEAGTTGGAGNGNWSLDGGSVISSSQLTYAPTLPSLRGWATIIAAFSPSAGGAAAAPRNLMSTGFGTVIALEGARRILRNKPQSRREFLTPWEN